MHTHNDRGTGVAATELALLAGADRVVTPDLFRAALANEMEKLQGVLGPKAFEGGRFAEAIRLFADMSLSPSFEEFLTLPAYRLID